MARLVLVLGASGGSTFKKKKRENLIQIERIALLLGKNTHVAPAELRERLRIILPTH